jgi:hypothetical protein
MIASTIYSRFVDIQGIGETVMQEIEVTHEHLSLFRVVQVKERRDWWAAFSAEPTGEVFPFATRAGGLHSTGEFPFANTFQSCER